jgi:hypothetical protein
VELKNESYPRRVPIIVEDSIFRWPNWRIDKSSHDWVKNGNDLIRFNLLLGLGEEQILTYTVIYTLSPVPPPAIRGKQPPMQPQTTARNTSPSTSSTSAATASILAESLSSTAIAQPLSPGGLQQEPVDGQKRRGLFDLFKKEETGIEVNLASSTALSSSPGTTASMVSSVILGIGTRSAGAGEAPRVEPTPARRGFFDLFKKNPENNPVPPSSSGSLSSLVPEQRYSGRSSGGSSSSMDDELLPGGDKPDEDYQL